MGIIGPGWWSPTLSEVETMTPDERARLRGIAMQAKKLGCQVYCTPEEMITLLDDINTLRQQVKTERDELRRLAEIACSTLTDTTHAITVIKLLNQIDELEEQLAITYNP